MKENLLSVIIALFLASVIFFGLLANFDSFEKLQTNVVGAEKEQLIWDIVIETYEDRLEVVANKDIAWLEAMSIMLLRNKNEVTPDFSSMKWVWNTELTEEYESRVTVFVWDIDWLNQDTDILSLPLGWNVSQISVSDVVLLFNDGSSERASLSTNSG